MYAIIATFDRVFTHKITELQNELTNVIGTNQLAGVEPHITLADYNELDVHLYMEKLGVCSYSRKYGCSEFSFYWNFSY